MIMITKIKRRLFIFLLIILIPAGIVAGDYKYLNTIIDQARKNKVDIVFTNYIENEKYIMYTNIYSNGGRVFYVNMSHPYWRDPEKNAKHAYDVNWYSTDSIDHIILHELGHVKLFDTVGYDRFITLTNSLLGIEKDTIIANVSRYAASNNIEFVSEVYAGLECGKKYPKEIMDYYNLLWVR